MSTYYPETPFEEFVFFQDGSKAFLNMPKTVRGRTHYLTAACTNTLRNFSHTADILERMDIHNVLDNILLWAAAEIAVRFGEDVLGVYQDIRYQVFEK